MLLQCLIFFLVLIICRSHCLFSRDLRVQHICIIVCTRAQRRRLSGLLLFFLSYKFIVATPISRLFPLVLAFVGSPRYLRQLQKLPPYGIPVSLQIFSTLYLFLHSCISTLCSSMGSSISSALVMMLWYVIVLHSFLVLIILMLYYFTHTI